MLEDAITDQRPGRDGRSSVASRRLEFIELLADGGDTLGEIASAHGQTLKVLLAFPENAKYRANPGLIHPGDVVRVK